MPAFADDLDVASLRTSLERSRPPSPAARRLLELLDATPDGAGRGAAIARAFRVVRVRDPLLLTAYFEPELAGSLAADDRFRFPLYARPPDLIDVDPRALDPTCTCRRLAGRTGGTVLEPYPSRAEIEAGALAGRGLEIAWTDDPVSLSVLHVQGSGRLVLADGRRLGVRYAGTNGRRFRSLAHVLVARGLLDPEQASLPAVRRILASLPAPERAALLAANDRYTFFRLAEGGPVGSAGVELTPGRSVATDPRLVPMGSIGYLVTPSMRRFVVSQDTGVAIVGAHADLFLGSGPEAEAAAGRMRERGTLYLLQAR